MNTLIVIPCYNEEQRLPVEEFLTFLDKEVNGIDLLFVNDGSTDKTIDILNEIKTRYKNVNVLDLHRNVGKAEAVRTAMLQSSTDNYTYVGYFDADLATPLNEINAFIKIAEEKDPIILMGSRVNLLGLTDIKRKWYRHYFGRIFATFASNILNIAVYDTQCGAKMIKQTSIKELFDAPFISSWLFDVELLFRLKKTKEYSLKPIPIIEIPLSKWEEKGESKIPISYLLKVPFELLRIYYRYK